MSDKTYQGDNVAKDDDGLKDFYDIFFEIVHYVPGDMANRLFDTVLRLITRSKQ